MSSVSGDDDPEGIVIALLLVMAALTIIAVTYVWIARFVAP